MVPQSGRVRPVIGHLHLIVITIVSNISRSQHIIITSITAGRLSAGTEIDEHGVHR